MFTTNRLSSYELPLDADDESHLSPAAAAAAERMIALCPQYVATPLRSMAALARRFGVACVLVKDEASRFGLGSFKALGGAYAVLRVFLAEASKRLGREVQPAEIGSAELRVIADDLVFACATAGNHGRSVAAGAHFLGCRAVVFLHQGVSPARAEGIEQFGAAIHRVDGSYDDSVSAVNRSAAENGWHIISDTSWPGYEDVPRLVTQGYTVMLREIQRELAEPPTHVFVQAGVGGLAATVAAYFSLAYGSGRPKVIVVEPDRAACLYSSHQAGQRTSIPRDTPTVMACLECYIPSRTAWETLSRWSDAFMTVPDEAAVEAMRVFAEPGGSDDTVVSGASGAAGLAGFITAMRSTIGNELGIDAASRILLFNTEGATDLGLYAQLVARTESAATA